MGNYGATYGGTGTHYNDGSYTPSPAEYLQQASAGPAPGQGAVVPYVPPISVIGQAGNVGSIVAGVGTVIAAGIEIFGTDGALTPYAAIQAAGGLEQIWQGVQGLTGGGTVVPGQTALTPTQATQLQHAADGTWFIPGTSTPDADTIAAAVWRFQVIPDSLAAGDALVYLTNTLNQVLNWGGQVLGPSGEFSWMASSSYQYPQFATVPMVAWAEVLADDTLVSWLTRINPTFTVAQDGTTGQVVLYNGADNGGFVCRISDNQFELLKQMTLGLKEWGDDYHQYRMYTPSGGGDPRLLIADGSLLFALIPIRFT